MPLEISGPAWSKPGLDIVGGRYPLRVEAHLGRLVQRLLPGVITTTYHARTFALHGLVWAEVEQRGLDLDQARELMRRSEVVLAAISLHHDHHAPLPEPHGGDVVAAAMAADGYLDIRDLQQKGRYTQADWGFASAYLGSETLLGIAGSGQPPTAGERVEPEPLRSALGGILELAREDTLDLMALKACPELCLCGARHAADGEWLRRVFLVPAPSEGIARTADETRRATARLVARVVSGEQGAVQGLVQRKIGFGSLIDEDPVVSSIPLAQAWRGAILRNYSVGAWRRMWSWIVDQLSEPRTPGEIGNLFAEALPELTVRAFLESLPSHIDDGVLLAVEEELRSQHPTPHPETELKLLALGTLRLDDLDGRALDAFAGDPREDDLGPRWFRERLALSLDHSLNRFGAELAEELIRRAWRVAFSKMALREDGTVWFPSRIREREGLIFRQASEGFGDVALRIESLGSLLVGMGVIDLNENGWELTNEGEAALA